MGFYEQTTGEPPAEYLGAARLFMGSEEQTTEEPLADYFDVEPLFVGSNDQSAVQFCFGYAALRNVFWGVTASYRPLSLFWTYAVGS